jgi:hypothetical protein
LGRLLEDRPVAALINDKQPTLLQGPEAAQGYA